MYWVRFGVVTEAEVETFVKSLVPLSPLPVLSVMLAEAAIVLTESDE